MENDELTRRDFVTTVAAGIVAAAAPISVRSSR